VKWAFDKAHEIPKHDEDYLEHQHVLWNSEGSSIWTAFFFI
jgi:hypothetical protein